MLNIAVFASKLGGAVVGGKSHADLAMIAGRGPDQALLELRQHPPCAEHDPDVLALAPRKLHTVDLAQKIDGDLVAVRRGAGHRRILHLLLAQALDHRIDVALGDLGAHALELERIDRLQCHLGENLKGRHIAQVLSLVDALRFDARVAGGRQLFRGHCLGKARLQQFADHLAVHLHAELLADHLDGRLARAKTF